MPRGKAEFCTMKPITTEPGNVNVAVQKNELARINARTPRLPGDPMRNIMGRVENDIVRGTLTKNVVDEALASIKITE